MITQDEFEKSLRIIDEYAKQNNESKCPSTIISKYLELIELTNKLNQYPEFGEDGFLMLNNPDLWCRQFYEGKAIIVKEKSGKNKLIPDPNYIIKLVKKK